MEADMTEDDGVRRIAELEDEIKQRDRRIAELKQELDEQRDLVHRMSEHVQDENTLIESWIEAFDMVLDDKGDWVWSSAFVEGHGWFEKYVALGRKWNKFVPDYNAAVRPRNVGRPLEASKAQQREVPKLHKSGMSLRSIAEETGLGFRTVRTIVDRDDGRDRTTVKHLQRIDPDRAAAASWKTRKRTRDALPARINSSLKDGRGLIREAKGLGD
jgi:hypothetical protein